VLRIQGVLLAFLQDTQHGAVEAETPQPTRQ
jgi:hypothetical protein